MQKQQQQHKRIRTTSPYRRDRCIIPIMDSERQIDFPLPRVLRNAGISRVCIESPYLTIYRRDNRMPTGHIPIALVELHGSWKVDRARHCNSEQQEYYLIVKVNY